MGLSWIILMKKVILIIYNFGCAHKSYMMVELENFQKLFFSFLKSWWDAKSSFVH